MLIIAVILFALFASISANAVNSSITLYVFQYNGLWGYMDKQGNVIVDPIYDKAFQYSDGLALVSKSIGQDTDGFTIYKYGYIDINGEEIIPIVYDYATSFVNGNAVIEKFSKDISGKNTDVLNGTRYWINTNGKYFLKESLDKRAGINNLYETAYPFCDGLARMDIGTASENTCYNDKQGNTVTQYYDGGFSFSEGLAAVYIVDWDTFTPSAGYINSKGEMALAPRFSTANSFSEGLALVCDDGKWGYIDKTGTMKIPTNSQFSGPFKEGIAAVQKNELYGFINQSGDFVIKPKYKNVEDVYEGLIMVKNKSGDFLYYIDLSEKIIKPNIK